jgi:hypothetical protein
MRLSRTLAAVMLAASSWLAGCGTAPTASPTSAPAGAAERPADKALLAGIRAYDDALYPEAEKQFRQALGAGLASPRDRAAAHKHLAFIACTSNRMNTCEAEFSAARQADPAFALSKAEAGHPLWGPVYKRLQR